MRVSDFLIEILSAHAQTLTRLAALLGEESLMEVLEKSGEQPTVPAADLSPLLDLLEKSLEPPPPKITLHRSGSTYLKIKSSVDGMNLPEILEFYVWSYLPYRLIIESPVDLDRKFATSSEPQTAFAPTLLSQVMICANHWVRNLPLPPDLSKQAEQAARIPWLKFRMDLLRALGKPAFETLW